jgi:hypothetical protein
VLTPDGAQLGQAGRRSIVKGLLRVEGIYVSMQAAQVNGLALRGRDADGSIVAVGGSLGFGRLGEDAFGEVQLASERRQGFVEGRRIGADYFIELDRQGFDDATSSSLETLLR